MRYTIRQTVDISHPKPLTRYENALAVQGDDSAHQLVLTVLENGVPKDMSGHQISASFIRGADQTTRIAEGSATGNTVTVVFPAIVYLSGALVVRVRAIGSDGSLTLLNAALLVQDGDTDTYLNDDNRIPSVAALLALMDQMEASKNACNAATIQAIEVTEEALDAKEGAQAAADSANAAADRLDNLSIGITMLPASDVPDTDVTVTQEAMHAQLMIPYAKIAIPFFEIDDSMDLYVTVPDGWDGITFGVTNGVLEVAYNG